MDTLSRALLMMSKGKASPIGQAAFTTPGSFSWVCPVDVFSVAAVCVGGGGGVHYGGGSLGWKNNIVVVPGQTYQVIVGAGAPVKSKQGLAFISGADCIGSPSSFGLDGTIFVSAEGGQGVNESLGYVGDGGGKGGYNGGGGAAGYTGPGGLGNYIGNPVSNPLGRPGTGGGGASGSYYFDGEHYAVNGGGGVGILGQGASGTTGGQGGSGGQTGAGANEGPPPQLFDAGNYGGGGGFYYYAPGPQFAYVGNPGGGAVRIIWGDGRAFPSTMTGNM